MRATEQNLRRTRGRQRAAAVTIRDVAARAGVSVATVSRVLNGKELVREETSAQVLEAARSLRYVPNIAARSLSIRRSNTIGIVLPEVHGEFFSEVIRGVDVAARREGYHILVSGSHSNVAEMLDVVDAMRGRVDGLVVMAPDVAVDELQEDAVPLVLLNSSDQIHDAITIDNYGGARTMMRYLTSLGHTRIAFITGPQQNADARDRLRGYRQSMRGVGEPLEVRGDFTEAAGCEAARQLMAMDAMPTAIFAANDSMAIGALGALSEAGVSVPRDVSVAGFDDIPIARYVSPQLTTIGVDIAELGRRAFALLLDAIARPNAREPRRERISTTLVERKSCGAPRRGGQAILPVPSQPTKATTTRTGRIARPPRTKGEDS